MLIINPKESYFHSVQPVKYNNLLMGRLIRLKMFLESGYIYPEIELYNNLSKKYQKYLPYKFGVNDTISLATTYDTKLNPPGYFYTNGEFSATYYIASNPCFVFDKNITNGHEPSKNYPGLSEEVCIKGKIPLNKMKALSLPYKTPINYINWLNTNINILKDFDLSFNYYQEIFTKYYNNPSYLETIYKKINLYQNTLYDYGYKDIYCVNTSGYTFDIVKDKEALKENEEKIRKILKI